MITHLELENLSRRLDGRFIKRKFRLAKSKINKLIKARIRRTRSRAIQWYRQQYFISNAYRDSKTYIAKNEDIYITMIIIAVMLGYSYAVVAAEIFHTFFLTAYIFADTSGFNMLLMILFTAAVTAVTVSWLAAFTMNTMAIAIMQGATQKVNRSVKKTVRTSLAMTTRTTASWTLVLASTAWPVALGGIGALATLKLGVLDGPAYALSIPAILLIVGLAFSIRNLLKYSLVPYIALFESYLPFDEAFKRSEQLVKKRGKLFMAAVYVSLGLILGAIYSLAWAGEKLLHIEQSVTFIFGLSFALMVANAIMVAFYRKRRLARTN